MAYAHAPPEAPTPRRTPVLPMVGAVFASICLALTGAVAIFVLPKFLAIFADFDVPLPKLTAALAGVPAVAVGGICVAGIVGLIGFACLARQHRAFAVLCWLAVLGAIALAIAVVFGAFLPLPAIINHMAQ